MLISYAHFICSFQNHMLFSYCSETIVKLSRLIFMIKRIVITLISEISKLSWLRSLHTRWAATEIMHQLKHVWIKLSPPSLSSSFHYQTLEGYPIAIITRRWIAFFAFYPPRKNKIKTNKQMKKLICFW